MGRENITDDTLIYLFSKEQMEWCKSVVVCVESFSIAPVQNREKLYI